MSALRRMAYRDHPQVELKSGDTVVFSATPIPGNERAVNETIDRLYHIGCEVVTARDAPIHASGHGYAEEVKMMINLTRPKYVMPVHGDFKRMLIHSQLAQSVGVPASRIFRTENGTPLEIDADGARFGKPETAGMIFVDGVDIGDVSDVALRDRRMLCADGIFIIVATVSEKDGSSVVPPEVLARGVPFLEGNSAFIDELREAVEDSLDTAAEQQITETDVLESLPARRSRDLHLRTAQAASHGLAGGRRGLIRPAGADHRRGQHEHDDADAGGREGGARGAERDDRAAEQEADAGHAAPSDSSRPDIRAWYSDGVASCSSGHHGDPLHAVAGAAEDRGDAGDRQRLRLRHAQVGEARPPRWRSGSSSARRGS